MGEAALQQYQTIVGTVEDQREPKTAKNGNQYVPMLVSVEGDQLRWVNLWINKDEPEWLEGERCAFKVAWVGPGNSAVFVERVPLAAATSVQPAKPTAEVGPFANLRTSELVLGKDGEAALRRIQKLHRDMGSAIAELERAIWKGDGDE